MHVGGWGLCDLLATTKDAATRAEIAQRAAAMAVTVTDSVRDERNGLKMAQAMAMGNAQDVGATISSA